MWSAFSHTTKSPSSLGTSLTCSSKAICIFQTHRAACEPPLATPSSEPHASPIYPLAKEHETDHLRSVLPFKMDLCAPIRQVTERFPDPRPWKRSKGGLPESRGLCCGRMENAKCPRSLSCTQYPSPIQSFLTLSVTFSPDLPGLGFVQGVGGLSLGRLSLGGRSLGPVSQLMHPPPLKHTKTLLFVLEGDADLLPRVISIRLYTVPKNCRLSRATRKNEGCNTWAVSLFWPCRQTSPRRPIEPLAETSAATTKSREDFLAGLQQRQRTEHWQQTYLKLGMLLMVSREECAPRNGHNRASTSATKA